MRVGKRIFDLKPFRKRHFWGKNRKNRYCRRNKFRMSQIICESEDFEIERFFQLIFSWTQSFYANNGETWKMIEIWSQNFSGWNFH